MAAAAAPPSDGPMMAHLINRLRVLRKKRSRITKIEDGLAKGKLLNSDQEEILRSKAVVLAIIKELEDLRALSAVAAPAVTAEVPEKVVVVAAVEKDEKASTEPALEPEPSVKVNVQNVTKANPDQSIAVDESPEIVSDKLDQSLVEALQEKPIAEAGEKQQNLENGKQKESDEEEWHVQRRPFQVIRDRRKFNNDWDESRRGYGYGGVYPNGSRGVQGRYYDGGNYFRNDAYVGRGDLRGRGEYSNGQGQNYNTRSYQDGNVGRGGHGGQRGRGGYSNGPGPYYDTGNNQSSDGNVGRAGIGSQRGRGGNSNAEGQHYQRRNQNGGSTRGRGSGRGGGLSNDVKRVPSVPVAEQV